MYFHSSTCLSSCSCGTRRMKYTTKMIKTQELPPKKETISFEANRDSPSPAANKPTEDSMLNGEHVTTATPIAYTTFTRHQKRLLTLLLGIATITSPLTATIYFPLLPLLREHFHTSA